MDCILLSVLLDDLEALLVGPCFPVINVVVVVVFVDDAFPLPLFDRRVDCEDVFLLYVVDRLLPPLCLLFR